jgi:hypothetical protein
MQCGAMLEDLNQTRLMLSLNPRDDTKSSPNVSDTKSNSEPWFEDRGQLEI